MNRIPSVEEDTRLTILLALGLWAAGVVAGAAAGVFTRLGLELVVALAAFACAFAGAVYALDANVRAFTKARADRLKTMLPLLASVAALDLAFTPWDERLAAFPHAAVVLFVLPLAIVAGVALADARGVAALRSPEAKSPGASPAAP